MEEFKSWRSYWYFEDAVKIKARYIHDAEAQAFLNAVADTAMKRVQAIPAQSSLWRAQRGNDWQQGDEYTPDQEVPYPPERMKPRQDQASERRANPKGIPYLYLASCRQTALAEMRAGKESLISVGLFKTRRDLQIVNCMTDDKIHIYYPDHEPPGGERERSVWTAIDMAFATPVTSSDDVADYVPTQILAELFKTRGFDGVAYRSSLGSSHNIALFDLEAAELIDCSLFKVKDVRYEFESVGG